MEEILLLEVFLVWSRCSNLDFSAHCKPKADVFNLKCVFLALLQWNKHQAHLDTVRYLEWRIIACSCAAANLCMHSIKTERKMEREKEKRDSERELSADMWVRLTERTALQAGPSPSAPKMTHDCFDFCHPPVSLRPQTQASNKHWG